MMRQFLGPCPVCGGSKLLQRDVLWSELFNSWQLSAAEISYIDRQQGYHCAQCFNNLRAMALAAAILCEYKFIGTLEQFCESRTAVSMLEINQAGNLTPFLQKMSLHKLVEYPQFDMIDLDIESESFDLVIHSDTLEHIANPERALSECYRVLRNGGKCIFTVPIVVDRLSRSRVGLPPSYHGRPGIPAADQVVYTEFGADAWKTVLGAGFMSCEIFSFEYPAALVLIARK
ncbi:class I SAM-dependent methyltransferase [Pseudomonas saponiphila]|nr:class I SAM-dependent methyltransferase [Pseudomonas saponiphila]